MPGEITASEGRRSCLQSSSPSALRRDLLPVEPKLVAPVLTIERPDLVLLVDLDVGAAATAHLGLLLTHLLRELTTLVGGDLQLDRVDLGHQLVELIDQAAVPTAGQVAGLVDRKGLRHEDVLEDSAAEAAVLELVRRLVQPRLLRLQKADVLQVAQHGAIAERGSHDRPDPRRKVGLAR